MRVNARSDDLGSQRYMLFLTIIFPGLLVKIATSIGLRELSQDVESRLFFKVHGILNEYLHKASQVQQMIL